MTKLTSLLSELTFRNQDAFDKYNSAHKLRNSTKVTINGKKTTAGEAEKKSKPSTKKKTNIFDKPKKDKGGSSPEGDKEMGILGTLKALLFGKPDGDTGMDKSDKPSTNNDKPKKDDTPKADKSKKDDTPKADKPKKDDDNTKKPKKTDSTRRTIWKREPGAPYAEDDKYWADRFLPGDKVAGDITSEQDFNIYRTAKIGISLIDWFEAKDKKDFNYDFESTRDGSMIISSEDGPVNFEMFSFDKDGNYNFAFFDNDTGENTFGSDEYFGGYQGWDDPQFVYQSIRYITAQPETIQFLRGELTAREYKSTYEKMRKDIDAAWKATKSSKKNEISLKLKSIVNEITDDALLDKTIRYKDSMGRDKEIKMKTALSKTYQTAKEPGMQNAYRTAKAMWDKAHNSGNEPSTDKKPNRRIPVQKQEPQKISGSDLKTSAEKDKNIGMKGGPGSGRTAADLPMLRDLMPNANFDRKPLSAIAPIERQQISTIIDKLAELGKQARERGENAPNFNLCQVSVPGTNLYCDGNKGIPREDMPQFKRTPEPGSPADKLPKDKNGEVDTEEFFKQMLNKQGIKVSEPAAIKPDRLKATQSELVGAKVAGMEKALEENPQHPAITAPIYVSNDGYVLDGHHRWAAIVAYNAAHPDKPIPMQVRVIDEPIEPLVKRSNAFAEEMGIRAKKADTGSAGGAQPITK